MAPNLVANQMVPQETAVYFLPEIEAPCQPLLHKKIRNLENQHKNAFFFISNHKGRALLNGMNTYLEHKKITLGF